MLSATEILERVCATYNACASYADAGEVTTVSSNPSGPPHRRTQIQPFSTAFVRPDRFRFESRRATVGPESEWPLHVTWSSEQSVRSWWTLKPTVKTYASLKDAIAGTTGASNASRVLRLLVSSEADAEGIFPGARLLRRDELEGLACHVLGIQEPERFPETLWVAADSFLLQRVEAAFVIDAAMRERTRAKTEKWLASPDVPEEQRAKVRGSLSRMPRDVPDATVELTTVYRPQLDVESDEERFVFEPPFIGETPWG